MTDGNPVYEGHTELRPDGQQKGYIILSAEERAKGFVRPVRRSYVHVGKRPKHPLRNLTEEERNRYSQFGYVKFEEYPKSDSSITGRFWKVSDLTSGCGQVTVMSQEIAETYARDPKFYGGTYCSTCHRHFSVGEDGEFVWQGTDERVGT